MENILLNKQNVFEFTYFGLSLEFELYTKSFIIDKLKELENAQIIPQAKCINIPEGKQPFKELKKYYKDEQKDKRYFFAYIKFFEYQGEKYGLVGGKTNYIYPDINFDINTSSIARTFLDMKQYEWSREILIVNYYDENIKEKTKADKQAKFLEKFLQRQFNLFDS